MRSLSFGVHSTHADPPPSNEPAGIAFERQGDEEERSGTRLKKLVRARIEENEAR